MAVKFNLQALRVKKDIKINNIVVKEREILIKTNLKVEVRFSFIRKIKVSNNKIDDDLLQVLKKMAIELSKIAMKKGKKRISLEFFDQKTALKIASFEDGKFLRDYLSLMRMIEMTDEILYKDDKTVDHYKIIPKVSDYLKESSKEIYTVEYGKMSLELDFVAKNKIGQVYNIH